MLRKVISDDIHAVFKGLSHKRVTQYMSVHYNTVKETETQMNFYETNWNNKNGIYWAVELKIDEAITGVISVHDINDTYKRTELGYWLLTEYWGKGIIAEAGIAVIDYCFHDLDINRIYAYVEKNNYASQKIMEKLNFKHEGTMLQHEINREGKIIDLMIYGKLKNEAAAHQ